MNGDCACTLFGVKEEWHCHAQVGTYSECNCGLMSSTVDLVITDVRCAWLS